MGKIYTVDGVRGSSTSGPVFNSSSLRHTFGSSTFWYAACGEKCPKARKPVPYTSEYCLKHLFADICFTSFYSHSLIGFQYAIPIRHLAFWHFSSTDFSLPQMLTGVLYSCIFCSDGKLDPRYALLRLMWFQCVGLISKSDWESSLARAGDVIAKHPTLHNQFSVLECMDTVPFCGLCWKQWVTLCLVCTISSFTTVQAGARALLYIQKPLSVYEANTIKM